MDYQKKARKARMRLAALGVVAATAVVGGGVLAVTSLDDGSRQAGPGSGQTTAAPSPSDSATASGKTYTPATAPRVPLLKPRSNKNGIGQGFEHSGLGATSAAVTYWEDLAFVDDVTARKQLEAITSKDSQNSIDRWISDIRKVREGAGLPPSGGLPNELSFTTKVKAILGRSLDSTGDVVQVWMVYDRYATTPEKPADDNPLKDEVTDLIVKWEDGDWKVTEEPQYMRKRTGPRAYHPNSPWAFMDGWRMVSDA